jgi:hypothetical protein
LLWRFVHDFDQEINEVCSPRFYAPALDRESLKCSKEGEADGQIRQAYPLEQTTARGNE